MALDAMHDPGLRATLRRLGETIHLGEVRALIHHETPSSPLPTFREPPPDDAQLMFFVPTVHDAPLKDEMSLMDIAPFSLSKTIRHGVIRYELKDAVITIEGGAEVGLVTAYDYDIFIHMVTHLAVAMRDYRQAESKGLRPSLPPRTYRPTAAEILKFCRREQGGKQYEQLEPSLDRLQATRYKITNLTDKGSRRAAESFPLIGRYKVVSRTRSERVDQVEIDIPEWVYNGVVAPGQTPSILTLNPDYFLIARPLAKFIYRLARKACGTRGIAEYGLDTLYQRSGSAMPFRKFRDAIEDLVTATKTDPLPDFDIELHPSQSGQKLRMMDRAKRLVAHEAA
ncbi:MAG: replication initiator protein A [Hyphomicrobiaceae bacterium]